MTTTETILFNEDEITLALKAHQKVKPSIY